MKSESDSHPSSVEPIALDAPLSASQRAAIDAVLEQLRELPGALLPILHAIQAALGFVPPSALSLIANSLNLSRADVHGVISFYHDFRDTAPGRHRLQLCRAEACQAVGARALERHVCERLQINHHETTTDRSVSLEPVYCLGNCASGPSLMLDGKLHGRMAAARVDRLLDALDVAKTDVAQ